MESKEVIENNKLIASFMGNNNPSTFIYHSSWDWLIPVIDKITSHVKYASYKIHNSSVFSDGGIEINTKFIINTFSDVVDFIKWFNTQNK